MRLYTFLHSPNPLKIRIGLDEFDTDYEPVEINLFAAEHRDPSFADPSTLPLRDSLAAPCDDSVEDDLCQLIVLAMLRVTKPQGVVE